MDKATAVEVAHQIKELIKTREAAKLLDGCKEALIADDVEVQVKTSEGMFRTVRIPPHVMRYIVENGVLHNHCKLLVELHNRHLSDLAGIVVGED